MLKTFLLIFLLSLLSAVVGAQELSTKNKKAIKDFEVADALIKERKFPEAIRLLEDAIKKDPAFVEAHVKLGGSLGTMGDVNAAMNHYKEAADLAPENPKLAGVNVTLAEYYLTKFQYEASKKYGERALKLAGAEKLIADRAHVVLASAEFSLNAIQHPLSFKPIRMSDSINKFYSNYSPALSADELTLIYTKRDSPEDDEDIVISQKVNGKWQMPTTISDRINTNFNEGTCALSADGKTLVFVSCNRPSGFGSCDLYISYKKGDDWSTPVNIGKSVNSNVWDSEPSLSADGKTLYFSSERKGGVGKRDIWFTIKDDNGNWMQAVNIGKPINTPKDDVTPFIHANGKSLYYATNYYPGLGGFDIFYTNRLDSVTWSDPINIGYPINTNLNDGFLFITADGKRGYYAIYDKLKGGKQDNLLYEFEVPQELKEKKMSTYAKGHVADLETKKSIKAKIELIELKEGKVSQQIYSDSIKGDYLIVLTEGAEYAMHVSAPGYLFKSIYFDYLNPKAFNPLVLDIFLEAIKSGRSVVLNNIFFATNSANLESKSVSELNRVADFLRKNPKLIIEFGGHTDDVGSDQDNMELSLKRAKAVYDYLQKKGISASQLKFKGYGETKPLVPNDSDENRQKNRRIEFKVIG